MRYAALSSGIPFNIGFSRGDDLDEPTLIGLYDCYRSSFSAGPEEIWSLSSFTDTAILPTTGIFWLQCKKTQPSFLPFKALSLPIAAMAFIAINPPEIEILLLSTHFDWQKRGCASYILKAIITFCATNQIENIYLEVRSSNKEAQILYGNNEFIILGKRANYYKLKDGKLCDAHILHRKIIFSREQKKVY